MADGVTLYADVWRPAEGGPHHVLLVSHPYDKEHGVSFVAYAHPAWYAQQGYVVVGQDSRGRGRSEGVFYPFRHEAEDLAATIAWASALPGTTGKVATYGFSYPGLNQLYAAERRPPGLTAIAPSFTGARPYEDWFYRQGAFVQAFAQAWANFLAMDVAARAGDDAALGMLAGGLGDAPALAWVLPLSAYPPLAAGHAPYYHDWLAHPTRDPYWEAFEVDLGRIDLPALHIGGWWDVFVRGTVNDYRELAHRERAPQKLVLGPWLHMPWRPVGGAEADAASTVIDDWHLRFWREVLDGEATGVFDHPVTAYVLGEGWRDLDGWPPSAVRPVDWFLHSDGRALSKFGTGTVSAEPPGAEPPDVFAYQPGFVPVVAGGHSCCLDHLTPMGPADQDVVERTKLVLVYTSAPLARDLTIAGDVAVTLYAASSAPDTDFSARLCQVDAAGVSTNLLEGIVRARSRESLEQPTPITPGEVYEYRIDLGPIAVHLPAGHRLRLQVGSSDFPQWDRNLNTGGPIGQEPATAARAATQTLLHSERYPSRITLPVVPA
jgi:putative CocE/NonD family hydrolase